MGKAVETGAGAGFAARAVTLAASSWGVAFRVTCAAEDEDAVRAGFPAGSTPLEDAPTSEHFVLHHEAAEPSVYFVKRRGRVVARAASHPAALRALQKEIHLCVAEHAREHAFVHAGVVAWQGRAVICPGASFAGKSTLVWSMVEAGADYLSDEYAVFDTEGRVHPFALPIHLRTANGTRSAVTPRTVAVEPAQPALILFTRYREGARWKPRALTPGETVVRMIRHSIGVRAHPDLVLPALTKVSLQARTFRGLRGETGQIIEWIKSQVIVNNEK